MKSDTNKPGILGELRQVVVALQWIGIVAGTALSIGFLIKCIVVMRSTSTVSDGLAEFVLFVLIAFATALWGKLFRPLCFWLFEVADKMRR